MTAHPQSIGLLLCGVVICFMAGCGGTVASATGEASAQPGSAEEGRKSLMVDDLNAQLTLQLKGQDVHALEDGKVVNYGRVKSVKIDQFLDPHESEAMRIDMAVHVEKHEGQQSSTLSTTAPLFRASDRHLVGSWRFRGGPALNFVLTFDDGSATPATDHGQRTSS